MENIARAKSTKTADLSKDPRWGFSPVSRRYILRTGAVWKRLVKSGIVVDEEIAHQLAHPAQGTPRRPRVNNVAITADRDAVASVISDNFDVSRLTGAQLASIAASIDKLGLGRSTKTGRSAPPRRRAPAPTQASASESEGTDEDGDLTETTVASESDAPVRSSKSGDALTRVARQVSERLAASKPTPVSEPQSPPMARRHYTARRGMD